MIVKHLFHIRDCFGLPVFWAPRKQGLEIALKGIAIGNVSCRETTAIHKGVGINPPFLIAVGYRV